MNNQLLSIENIKKIMNELNVLCFDSQLVFDFPVVLINSGKALGRVNCSKLTKKINKLSISRCFSWTEKHLRDVIAHELIHVYEYQVLKIEDKKRSKHHGATFLNKMNELNSKHGLNIVVKSANIQCTKVKKDREVFLFISEDQKKFCFVNPTLAKSIHYNLSFHSTFGDYKHKKILKSQIKNFQVFNKYRGFYSTNEKTKLLLKSLGVEIN